MPRRAPPPRRRIAGVVTCSGDGSTGIKTANWLFENWARTLRVLVPAVYNPTTVSQIVAAVLDVEGRHETVKAIGSQWSYSGVAVDDSTQNVINTELLARRLNDADATKAIIPFALRGDLRADPHYVHVEAGIKVWELNCMLDEMLLAMPTLGGSNGQSIAGAVATGTHGTDVDAPPIADAVAAIHLVGPGGKEWWIERDEGDGAITDPARMDQAKARGLLCPDAHVEYDSSLFRAALVSMGRMGVVYSYVLKAVDRFGLTTTRYPSTWTAERAKLRMPRDPFNGARWLEIFVNPYPDGAGEHSCIVTERRVGLPPFAPDDPITKDTLQFFCESNEITQILVALNLGLPAVMAGVSATASATLFPLNGIPIVGPFLFASAMAAILAPYTLLQEELAVLLAQTPTGNFAEHLATVINQAVRIPYAKAIIPAIVGEAAKGVRSLADDGKTRPSFQNYTGQRSCPQAPPSASNCERQMDGLEVAFDMRPGQTNLFDFIDDVFAAADAIWAANTPAAFGMSLRFTGKTEALLGMQQWDRTCIVELFALRGVASTAGWITKLHELGARHGAIPHWGLLNDLTASQVHDRYPYLSEWRQALRLIIDGGGGRAETFRTTYSIQRGLEPETYVPASVAVPLDESGATFPYDFGTVQLHDRKSVEFHFANDGEHTLRVLGHDADGDFRTQAPAPVSQIAVLSPGDFAAAAFPGDATGVSSGRPPSGPAQNLEVVDVRPTALPNEEIRVRVTFSALRPGVHQGMLKIYVNAANLDAILIPIRASVEAFDLAIVQPPQAVLDLGAVAIGSEANATVLVRNDSTIAAWLGDVSFTDPRPPTIVDLDPGPFGGVELQTPWDENAVRSQIAVQTGSIGSGQTRTFALSYRPSFVGFLDANLVLHFTDGATPPLRKRDLTVRLRGIGRGAQAELSPREFDFGQAPAGAEGSSTRITLRNVGLDPLTLGGPLVGGDYELVSPLPATLAGGQSLQLELRFRPQGLGARDSSFSVSTDGVYPPAPVELHGIGIAAPVLRATPDAVAFDDTVVGSTRAAALTVDNPGAVPVSIGTVGLQAPGEFRVVRDTCTGTTLGPGARCEVDVVFEPASAGGKSGTLEISGPTQPLRTPLAGTALPAAGLVPDVSDVDFGPVSVGSSSPPRRVALTNRAATVANVIGIQIQGPAAAEVAVVENHCDGAALMPGASCTVDLQLKPAGIGARSAMLTALADVPAHPATLHALGRGASVAWIPDRLDFGNMNVGVQTPAQSAELRNTGNTALEILEVELTGDGGDFVVTDLTPGITRLQPNGEKGFRIRFKPLAVGDRQGLLTIHSDAADSPHVLTLVGVAFDPS
jgi:hypothetical protein